MMTRPKIGLALGGGGARGYAHLGVIQTLERRGIPIDMIAGTSMGAVIGGACASGVDLVKLERLIKRLDLNRMLHFPRSSLRGVLSNTASDYLSKKRDWRHRDLESTRALIEFFDLFSQGKAFAELEIPLAVMAVDIDTGEGVVIREGPLSRALAAAISIPGLHYPVEHRGRYLVDGGLVNNLPADVVAASLGADVVIAVDVGAPLTSGVTTSMDVLIRAESIILRELTRLRLKLYRQRLGDRLVVLHPPMGSIETLALDEVDAPLRAGMEETERRIDEIKASLERCSV